MFIKELFMEPGKPQFKQLDLGNGLSNAGAETSHAEAYIETNDTSAVRKLLAAAGLTLLLLAGCGDKAEKPNAEQTSSATATPSNTAAPIANPEQTLPPATTYVSKSHLPESLASDKYISLPNSTNPTELTNAYCKAISTAITSERTDALQLLYSRADSTVLNNGDLVAVSLYHEQVAEVTEQFPDAEKPDYTMSCTVVRADKSVTTDGKESFTVKIDAIGQLTQKDGGLISTFIDGVNIIDRTVRFTPGIETLLPNGEYQTGTVVTEGILE